MTFLTAHRIYAEDVPAGVDGGKITVAIVHPASQESVQQVLAADPNADDGRSQWMWVRLNNGDLILGLYPQGDTYCAVEEDAATPDGV